MARQKYSSGGITMVFPSDLIPKLSMRLLESGIREIKMVAGAIARSAVEKAPQGETGNLRRGIVVSMHPEQSSRVGKYVFQVFMDPGMNAVFAKYTKSDVGGNSKRYYYPASQEYGFVTKKGGYVPGKYFMKIAALEVSPDIIPVVQKIVNDVLQEAAADV